MSSRDDISAYQEILDVVDKKRPFFLTDVQKLDIVYLYAALKREGELLQKHNPEKKRIKLDVQVIRIKVTSSLCS